MFGTIFSDLIEEGRLQAAEEVFRELNKQDDSLFAWCKDRRGLFVEDSLEMQQYVRQIMAECPLLVNTERNRSGGDPYS